MPRSLRILMIAETYPPDYGGGAAIYIRDLCRGLVKRGHKINVLCVSSHEAPPYSIQQSCDGAVDLHRVSLPYFRTVDPEGSRLGIGEWIRHERRIAAIIADLVVRFRPDIAQYNTARPFGEEAILALHRMRIPVVAMFHEAWLICARVMLLRSPLSSACDGPGPVRCPECVYSNYDGSHVRAMMKMPWRVPKLGLYPLFRLWRRLAARRKLSGGIGYSRFMTAIHQRHIRGIVRYIPLGIGLAASSAASVQRPRVPLRFGFVGGTQTNKGLDDLLSALAALHREGLPFELHVWGPGVEKAQADVDAHGLGERVRIRGAFAEEDRSRVYSDMDVAVMATVVNEPFGRVVQEAALSGAPTVGPAVGGIAEQIRDEVDGLLYRFRDPVDLQRQLRRLIADPALLPKLIANLPPVRSTGDAIPEVEQLYLDVLASRGAEEVPPWYRARVRAHTNL